MPEKERFGSKHKVYSVRDLQSGENMTACLEPDYRG